MIPETRDHLPVFLHLIKKDLSHQTAHMKDLGICNAIIDIDALPPGSNHPFGPQDAHMLGKVGLAESDLFDQFRGGDLFLFQRIENLKPLGIRENFAKIGM